MFGCTNGILIIMYTYYLNSSAFTAWFITVGFNSFLSISVLILGPYSRPTISYLLINSISQERQQLIYIILKFQFDLVKEGFHINLYQSLMKLHFLQPFWGTKEVVSKISIIFITKLQTDTIV